MAGSPNRHARGITLIEIVIILSVMAALTGILVPTVSATIGKSRLHRARTDVIAIKKAVVNMLIDTNTRGIVRDGSVERGRQQPVHLLVGDGDAPALGPDGDPQWTGTVNLGNVDFIEYHLCTNRPGNAPDHAYANWNGAYLTAPIMADPWGNHYMINCRYLFSGSRYDVVVLSAGPDEEVDSKFTVDGFVPGDDDVVCLISSGTIANIGGTSQSE